MIEAVLNGEFNDADAAAVSGLDPMDNGNAHRRRNGNAYQPVNGNTNRNRRGNTYHGGNAYHGDNAYHGGNVYYGDNTTTLIGRPDRNQTGPVRNMRNLGASTPKPKYDPRYELRKNCERKLNYMNILTWRQPSNLLQGEDKIQSPCKEGSQSVRVRSNYP